MSDRVDADASRNSVTTPAASRRHFLQASAGLWLRRSSGTMRTWTHPGTFERLGEDASRYADLPNADATLVGFATGHASPEVREAVYRDIVAPWRACAMDQACIAPAGSSLRLIGSQSCSSRPRRLAMLNGGRLHDERGVRMREVIDDIEAWRRRGDRIALATVVSTRRSAPRPPGAKMAINEHGEVAGAVSGGCVEGAVATAAYEVLESGRPRLLSFGIADSDAWDVGLPCGGEIDVFVEELRP